MGKKKLTSSDGSHRAGCIFLPDDGSTTKFLKFVLFNKDDSMDLSNICQFNNSPLSQPLDDDDDDDYLHHHHHQGLDPLVHSVSRVTAVRPSASLVFQLFSFLVVCSGMISKGFGFMAFFASVKACSICIHLLCLVCL
jgi:hypothetical protein